MSDATLPSTRRQGGREPHLTRRRLLIGGRRGSGRRCYGLTAGGAARRGLSSALEVLDGGDGDVRLERVGPGAEEGVRERLRGVHQEDRRRRQGQHRRPQHVPGADQQLPAGQARRRVHLVRRLPDAVLRAEGPARRRSTTSGRRSRRNSRRRCKAASTGARRPPVLRADLQLPVGGLLPQERVREERLHGPEDAGTSSSRWPRR